jgi:hypothetical protein
MWRRREIENYFCTEDVLLRYAHGEVPDDLFSLAQRTRRDQAMQEAIKEVASALETFGKPDPWSSELKATDDFLDPLFRVFFKKLALPLGLRKSGYYTLARLMPKEKLDTEIREKLDLIATVASQATPQQD